MNKENIQQLGIAFQPSMFESQQMQPLLKAGAVYREAPTTTQSLVWPVL